MPPLVAVSVVQYRHSPFASITLHSAPSCSCCSPEMRPRQSRRI